LDSIQSIGHGFADLVSTLQKPVISSCFQKHHAAYTHLSKDDILIPSDQLKHSEAEAKSSGPEETAEWKEYRELMMNRPELFQNSGLIDIVTDWDIAGRYGVAHGRKIGVIYKSPYQMLVVDVISDPKGGYSTYERIVPTVPRGSVVVFATIGTGVVLLKQYRHALRDYEYSLPRGYAEKDLSAQENARKEVREELGAEVLSIKPLGTVVADSGLSGGEASVFRCAIGSYEVRTGYEGIENIVLLEIEEFEDWIRKGRIKDGFTLAAYSLYRASETNGIPLDS
jgi:ADP-ribose pyrophosphatase